MSTAVRAKFRCVRREDNAYTSGVKYTFAPHYDNSIAEDQRYAKASPTGELWIQVDNPAVDFELGAYYYLDFTVVPAESSAA